uniref:cytoplasmic polyadenylation element-binding protein 1-B-like n=1 Tax=Myxine glutinosa TaxID=7769 RepID=UPI00358FAF84
MNMDMLLPAAEFHDILERLNRPALSGPHPVGVIQPPPPGRSTSSVPSAEHLESASSNCVNNGMADPGVKSSADSCSEGPADPGMRYFRSGSDILGDFMSLQPGLHGPSSLNSPARSPLTASSRDPCPIQMRAARASQAREGVRSPGFEPESSLGEGAKHTPERYWRLSEALCLGQGPPPPPQAECSKQSSYKDPVATGYAYLVFLSQVDVQAFLRGCRRCPNEDRYALHLCMQPTAPHDDVSRKEVEVMPWFMEDLSIGLDPGNFWEPGLSVFVGALHGTITARGLAQILNDLFGGVVYVGYNTDKHQYPNGSARVMFGNRMSCIKAVEAEFVEIRTPKLNTKIRINPFVQKGSLCDSCFIQPATAFCRNKDFWGFSTPSYGNETMLK